MTCTRWGHPNLTSWICVGSKLHSTLHEHRWVNSGRWEVDKGVASPAFLLFGGRGKKNGLVALASTTHDACARSYSCMPIRLLYSVM